MIAWRALGLVAALLSATPVWSASPEPIVIGQSIAEGRGSFRASIALIGGLRAYIGRINAIGGIDGRPIKVVTLMGDATPQSHVDNVHTLVREHGAVAIVGCGGDAVCSAVGGAAAAERVPLIGALSGQKAAGHDHSPYLFPLRASYDLEAQALVSQMVTLGISRVTVLEERDEDPERGDSLLLALKSKGLRAERYDLSWRDPVSLDIAINAIAKNGSQTVVLNVRPDTVDALSERRIKDRMTEWPPILMSMASSSFQGIGNVFGGKVLGYTQLVPNPEADSSSLVRDFLADAEKFASPKAITFEGLSNYMAGKVLVEALRRTRQHVSGEALGRTLSQFSRLDLGGYTVSFIGGRATGSDHVEVGLRSRDGRYLK
jgi:branched-chain amino acid transport system substrate-binding protein